MTTVTTYDESGYPFLHDAAPLLDAVARRYAREQDVAAALSCIDAATEDRAFVLDLWRIVRAILIKRGEIAPTADC